MHRMWLADDVIYMRWLDRRDKVLRVLRANLKRTDDNCPEDDVWKRLKAGEKHIDILLDYEVTGPGKGRGREGNNHVSYNYKDGSGTFHICDDI